MYYTENKYIRKYPLLLPKWPPDWLKCVTWEGNLRKYRLNYTL